MPKRKSPARSRLIAAAYIGGQAELRPELVRAQADIKTALNELDRINARLGNELESTAKLGIIKENAAFMASRLLMLPPVKWRYPARKTAGRY
ncbi:MAG: hypothetical protein H7228_15960 [Polaromonas sp.]|nr:hypothetical protein [Polaromonas sp.]